MQGYYFDDLEVGMEASYSRTVSAEEIEAFAAVSGDNNPVHLDEEFASASLFGQRIAHGLLSASYLSTIIGTKLPGPGCIYLGQSLSFRAPVYIGDEVTASATITELKQKNGHVVMDCKVHVGDREVLIGEALIKVPKRP